MGERRDERRDEGYGSGRASGYASNGARGADGRSASFTEETPRPARDAAGRGVPAAGFRQVDAASTRCLERYGWADDRSG